MNGPRSARYICKSCQIRLVQKRTLLTKAQLPNPLEAGFARLSSRKLLSIYGHDAAHFLQGLTTQNIPTSGLLSPPWKPQVLYSAFMNASGRLLQDVFIYPLHPLHGLRHRLKVDNTGNMPAFLIEADASQMPELYRFLKKYKLRASLKLRVLEEEEVAVWGAWHDMAGAHPEIIPEKSPVNIPSSANVDLLVAPDPRTPAPWSRIIAPAYDDVRIGESSGLIQASETVYRLKRYLNGVPEGQEELPAESSLLHEANIDLMQGVDFRKGCYVGQELVIRTQHTGVVRKRVMPVQLWASDPPNEDELQHNQPVFSGDLGDLTEASSVSSQFYSLAGQRIRSKDSTKAVGKFLGSTGNIGLALCRLENVIELEDGVAKGRTRLVEMDLKQIPAPFPSAWMRPFIPEWWKARGEYKDGGYENLKARAPGRKSLDEEGHA